MIQNLMSTQRIDFCYRGRVGTIPKKDSVECDIIIDQEVNGPRLILHDHKHPTYLILTRGHNNEWIYLTSGINSFIKEASITSHDKLKFVYEYPNERETKNLTIDRKNHKIIWTLMD